MGAEPPIRQYYCMPTTDTHDIWMHITLRHLRYFVAVAEELHFSRAARRLNVSQPPLSQQIRQLEDIVGSALFVRTSRRVQLTSAGLAFLDGTRRSLAEVARTLAAAQHAAHGERDMLRVGFTDSAALGGLVEILRTYRVAYPDVHLDLIEGTSQAQLDALERDTVDVALVRGPVASVTARTIIVRREPFEAAVPADHPLAKRRGVPLAALRGQPFVLFPRHLAPAFHDVVTAMCRRAGFSPEVRHESADYQTMLSLVAAGLGVTIVPASVRNLGRIGVEFRPLAGPKVMAELALMYRPARLSRALEAFIAIASMAPGRK
jgi:LysR family transcriptional regulator, benzoate and cis,cis-muconate-responsive activator of ben and cat genes